MHTTRSCSAPAPRARSAPAASPTAASRWRSSSSDLIGGECSYYACMPSKALLRPADVLGEAQRLPGVPVGAGAELDPQAILARRDEVIHDLDDSVQLPWLEERGIDLYRGAGRFDGERRVARRRRGARRPQGRRSSPPAAARRCRRSTASTRSEAWNNREATTAEAVPASMIVLGGGPVGSELSQAWASPGDQGDAGRGRRAPALARGALRRRRSRRRAARSASASTCAPGSRPRGSSAGGAGRDRRAQRRRAGSRAAELLVAVGRVPHTAELGLDAAGVEPGEHGFLETDDRLRVGGRDWLYAIGDVNGRALFTHIGKYQAWVAAENLLGREVEAVAEAHRLAARHLHRPPGRRGRQDARPGPRGRDRRAAQSTSPPTAPPGASFQGKDTGGTSRLVVDQARRDDRRRHLHRLRDRRLPPGGDRRDRRRGAAVPPAPRDRAYPSRSEIWLKLLEKYEA